MLQTWPIQSFPSLDKEESTDESSPSPSIHPSSDVASSVINLVSENENEGPTKSKEAKKAQIR